MNIMPPHKEPSTKESTSNVFVIIQYLYLYLHELLCMQQCRAPTPMLLNTCFLLLEFSEQMNGDNFNGWLHSISNYFNTCPEMDEEMKIQIRTLQLEGISPDWWNNQLEN
jgi:hypothetical protein